jgi:hypothetical protein
MFPIFLCFPSFLILDLAPTRNNFASIQVFPKMVGIMEPHYERTAETLEGRAPRQGPLGVTAIHTEAILFPLAIKQSHLVACIINASLSNISR